MSIIGDSYSMVIFSTLNTNDVPSGDIMYLIGKNISISYKSGHNTISLIYGDAVKFNLGKVSTTINLRGIVPLSIINNVTRFLDKSLRSGAGAVAQKLYLWVKLNPIDYLKFRKANDNNVYDYIQVWIDGYDFDIEHDKNVCDISIGCSYGGTLIL